jgi:hypothetical protein
VALLIHFGQGKRNRRQKGLDQDVALNSAYHGFIHYLDYHFVPELLSDAAAGSHLLHSVL